MILDEDATTFRPPNGSRNDRALAQITRSSSASVGKLGPNVSTFEMRAQTSSSPNATIRGGNDAQVASGSSCTLFVTLALDWTVGCHEWRCPRREPRDNWTKQVVVMTVVR